MTKSLICGIILIVSAVTLISDFPYGKFVTLGLIGFCFIISFINTEKSKGGIKEDSSCNSEKKNAPEELKTQVASLLRENSELNDRIKTQKQESTDHLLHHRVFTGSLPVIEKLLTTVTEKTESSVLELTENIFNIANNSSTVGNRLLGLLNEYFRGENNLENDIGRLIVTREHIEGIVKAFRVISRNYTKDMQKVEENIAGVKEFTGNITELADQTNVLAINATIVAARMGAQGKGFSVIANGVQELSKKSREIATKINEMITNTSETVDQTFTIQREQILKAIDTLDNTENELNEISALLENRIKFISSSTGESMDLSEAITKELHKITVSLQFQDITRQIIEHTVEILKHIENDFKETLEEMEETNIEGASLQNLITERVKRITSKTFSVGDEWQAIGEKIDETDNGTRENKNGLKGNITLF